MASKHLKQTRGTSRAGRLVVVGSVAIAFAAITAAIAVHLLAGRATPGPEASGPSTAVQQTIPQPLSQEGRLIAVTPSSVTAQSPDGFARTYAVTPETNAITQRGSVVGGAGTAFAVNDEVAIVGVVQDGTAVATAVADRGVTDLSGPPMDAV